MPSKVALLAVALAIVLLPWLVWRIPLVRRIAPLAVVQVLVGVALGPSVLGLLAPDLQAALFGRSTLAAVDGISSVGVVLYVFITGLHLDFDLLRRDGRRLGLIAFGSVCAPLLTGGAAGAWMLNAVPGALGPLGAGAPFVAAVAICIAVTALPVLAAVLQEMGLLRTRIGQTALALAALNDAALWAMLATLLALAGSAEHARGALPLAAACLWFAALVAARPLLARLARAGDQVIVVGGVGLAIASAAASEAFGPGYLIGAFMAGAIMPVACRAVLLARLEMVTATVLLPFFFMSTGLKTLIEPGSAHFLALLAVAVGAAVLGQLAGTALPARRLGFSWPESLSLGAMMQTKGLMEVVVLGVLHDAGLLGGQIFSAMVAMAVICTVLTAPAVRLCQSLELRPQPDAERNTEPS